MFRPDLLKSKRILITGGGTGLGRVCCNPVRREVVN